MRVVVPFTRLRKETQLGLKATGLPYTAVDVSGSDEAYWDLLAKLWEEQESFIVVEHDIVVEPESLKDLIECSHSWCSFRMEYFAMGYPGLGCAKFSGGFTKQFPNALKQISTMSDPQHAPRHWCRLDGWLQQVLYRAGAVQHVHDTMLQHVRDEPGIQYPSHGCVRREES